MLVECMSYRVGHHRTSDDSFVLKAEERRRGSEEDW